MMMLLYLAMFVLGLFAWTFIASLIHVFLGTIFSPLASPLHDEHHRDPHAVFTVGAWMPTPLTSLLVFGIFGLTPTTTVWLGIVAGFLSYEFLHYRMHFVRPLCEFEDRIRTRHLAHHFREPTAIFGVTNRIWDRAFGSEPDDARLESMRASVAPTRTLEGPSN